MSNLIGQRLGQYEIVALLGKGGMAAVYRARQGSMDRDVAIKVIKPDLAETGEFIERFHREARTVASLSHPHILKVFDYGQQDDLVYLVMELLKGGSLADRIRLGRLPLDTTAHALDQIALALDYAHRRGIVHRDLKPQNVLLDDDGNACLTDFGIAKIVGETQGLTQSGVAIGTPSYMAPEQWQGKPLDGRADIYALGIMLFEMLTGQLPFNGDTPFTIMHKHIYEPPPSIRVLRPDLPPGIEPVINRAFAKSPEQRFSSAGELATAFGAVQAGNGRTDLPGDASEDEPTVIGTLPVSPVPSSPVPQSAPRSRGGLFWGLTVAVVAVLIISGGLLLLPRLSSSIATPTATGSPPLTLTQGAAIVPSSPATATPEPSLTSTPTHTTTASPTALPTVTPTNTSRPTLTATPTIRLTAPATLNDLEVVGTLDAQETSTTAAQLIQGQTATAAQWTPTPVPNRTATINILRTERAAATATIQYWINQTTTATSWTLTPTPTFTSTTTSTRTPTWTPSSTRTSTPTPLPTHTLPPTATSTQTSTPVPPTATFDLTHMGTVTANSQWKPVAQSVDGVEMVLVPPGCYTMGSESGNRDEKPLSRICFDKPFWIDRTEVTNEQFAKFGVQAGRDSYLTDPKRPRERITWLEAQDFCTKRGARLPTEAEWEYAARGPENLVYPWGNSFVASNVVYLGNSGSQSAEVGSKLGGASWVGAYDLSGNVAEWVSSRYMPYPYKATDGREKSSDTNSFRTIRGGSWDDVGNSLRPTRRDWKLPSYTDNLIGFRCARSS